MAALPTKLTGSNPSHLLPSELVDKCVGSRLWVRPLPAGQHSEPASCTHTGGGQGGVSCGWLC